MCTVFLRHHLGRRGCGPERFRHHGEKSTVVDYRIGAVYRFYHLFGIRIQKREQNGLQDLMSLFYFRFIVLIRRGNNLQHTTNNLQIGSLPNYCLTTAIAFLYLSFINSSAWSHRLVVQDVPLFKRDSTSSYRRGHRIVY